MKKIAFFSLLLLCSFSAFADGHNLDGLVFYFAEIAIVYFVLPWTVITILCVFYKRKPKITVLVVALILLLCTSIANIYYFIEFKEVLVSERVGSIYVMVLLLFIVAMAFNLYQLMSGYKMSRIINDQ